MSKGAKTDTLTNVRVSALKGILVERLKFPESTLADLYDPLSMLKELLDAHRLKK